MSRMWTAIVLCFIVLDAANCREKKQSSSEAVNAEAKLKKHPPLKLKKPTLPVRRFPNAGRALQFLLSKKPQFIGFGEYHQRTDSTKVRSAVKRFTNQMLQVLSKQTSDIVVETWVAVGQCGKQEKQVVKKVDTDIKRPQATENEVLSLLKRAKTMGIQPHILRVRCEEYKNLMSKGRLDYENLLGMITRHLLNRTREVYRFRQKAAVKTTYVPIIAVYGGALHNDLHPDEDLKKFSYVKPLKTLSANGYLEIDLYVPEYIDNDKNLSPRQWYPIFKRNASTDHVLLIQRGENSYILIFRRGVAQR